MKAIILAAGKGSRLKTLTQAKPKCLAITIQGRPILDHLLDTLHECGVTNIAIVRGYLGHLLTHEPIKYYENTDFENNNIMESLFFAEESLNDDVIVTYADLWLEKKVVMDLMKSVHDIALSVDEDWKAHHSGKSNHPVQDAEFAVWDKTLRISKVGKIARDSNSWNGEYIGVCKFSKNGCNQIKHHYHSAKHEFSQGMFQRSTSFKKAYLTDLFQYMIDCGTPVYAAPTQGKWIEIDTPEDLSESELFFQKQRGPTG